jgi:hypothetical protein
MGDHDTIETRASDAPIAFLCGGSVRPATLAVRERNDAADLGSAVHEVLRNLAESGSVNWAETALVAARWGVPEDDLRMLAGAALKLWEQVGETFARAITEVPFRYEGRGWVLTGHADLLAEGDGVARLADWKSGRKDADYSQQMQAYGALALLDDPSLREVTVTILWIRDAAIENYTMTREKLHAWLARFEERVVRWDGTYRPGSHCHHCQRSHECAAGHALARRDAAALLDTGLADALTVAQLEPAQKVELFRRATLAMQLGERVRAAIRGHIELHGDVECGPVRLTIEREERREIDTLKAWPVLEKAGLGDAELAACVDVRISKAEKIIAKRAGFGKGAAAVREFDAELTRAGAVQTKEVRKLVEKRNEKP